MPLLHRAYAVFSPGSSAHGMTVRLTRCSFSYHSIVLKVTTRLGVRNYETRSSEPASGLAPLVRSSANSSPLSNSLTDSRDIHRILAQENTVSQDQHRAKCPPDKPVVLNCSTSTVSEIKRAVSIDLPSTTGEVDLPARCCCHYTMDG